MNPSSILKRSPLLAVMLAANAAAQQDPTALMRELLKSLQSAGRDAALFDSAASRSDAPPVVAPSAWGRLRGTGSRDGRARVVRTANDSCFDGSSGNGCPEIPRPPRPPSADRPKTPPPPPPPRPRPRPGTSHGG